jgi:hypothetical protein
MSRTCTAQPRAQTMLLIATICGAMSFLCSPAVGSERPVMRASDEQGSIEIYGTPSAETVQAILSRYEKSQHVSKDGVNPRRGAHESKKLQAADNRSTKTCFEKEKGTGSRPLASMWQPISGTSLSSDSSGMITVSCRNTFWGGAIAYPQVACNYRFDTDARLRAGGSGYGLAVRANVTNGDTPHGQGIQYDHGVGGLRDVLLPDHSESGTVKPATIDSEWHHISVAVDGERYQSSVDGKVVFSGPTTTTCGNGILIRVWRSTADFRNISVTPITALPAP